MHIPCYGIFALVIRLKHFWLSRSFPESYQCWENCLIERSLELQIAQKKQKFRVDMSWWWTLIRIIVALFVDCIGWTYPFSSSLGFKILSFFLQIQISDCVIENNQQTKLFIFLWEVEVSRLFFENKINKQILLYYSCTWLNLMSQLKAVP